MSAIVQPVVQQHAEDASILYSTRSVLLRAPHVKLLHLRRTDDRLDAHLDGLAVAGDDANQTCEALLERMWNPAVRVHGGLADLWAPYDFHQGGRFSHCGVDSFSLVRGPNGWLVASITYTVEQTGCAPSPLGPPKK